MRNLKKFIDQNGTPFYKKDLMNLLTQTGIAYGDVVILHASLRALNRFWKQSVRRELW